MPASATVRCIPAVPIALKALAERVAYRSDYEAFRHDFDVTCTDGVIGSLDASIFLGVLLQTGELILEDLVAKTVPRDQDLYLVMPTDQYYWSLRGGEIIVKEITTGTLGTADGSGTLTANRYVSLPDLPVAYEEELVKEVVGLLSGQPQSPVPMLEREDKALNVRVND